MTNKKQSKFSLPKMGLQTLVTAALIVGAVAPPIALKAQGRYLEIPFSSHPLGPFVGDTYVGQLASGHEAAWSVQQYGVPLYPFSTVVERVTVNEQGLTYNIEDISGDGVPDILTVEQRIQEGQRPGVNVYAIELRDGEVKSSSCDSTVLACNLEAEEANAYAARGIGYFNEARGLFAGISNP